MSELVVRVFTFIRGGMRVRLKYVCFGFVLVVAFGGFAHGQDNRKVPISFLPPPLENATYSLGIYEAKSGKLVRRLHEIAPENAFTVGLNGLITSWDGKDDEGKPVAPGRYAASGLAVGALKVEGTAISGNDWVADDENLRVGRIEAMALVPADNGLVVVGMTPEPGICVARYGGAEGKLLWRHGPVPGAKVFFSSTCTLRLAGDVVIVTVEGVETAYQLADGGKTTVPPGPPPDRGDARDRSRGKDDTVWSTEQGVLVQTSSRGEQLRALAPEESKSWAQAVAASRDSDRLYLLEASPNWQRLRGLSWKEAKEENGKPVSTWQTFFERTIRAPDPALGLDHPVSPVEIGLVENPLVPGKPQKVKLAAIFDDKGSFLTTADGLRLRQISQRNNLRTGKLARGKTANGLTFFQYDGAAWDEFSITGARNMMTFDAGEFEMTAQGEKTHSEKPAEPPDL